MRRALRILAAIAAIVAVGCAGLAVAFREPLAAVADVLIAAFEEPEWAELPDRAALLRYLQAHPDTVSVYAASVDADGQPIPDTVIAHRADVPRPLASAMKVVVLSAWARAIDDGALTDDATTTLGAWDSWYLAGYDAGAHAAAYDRLGIAHTDGVAADPGRVVPLADVVGAMIEESDNAATDLVIATLGPRLAAETALLGHAPIGPLLASSLHAFEADDPCADPTAPDLSDPAVRAARIAAGMPALGVRAQRARLGCVLPRGTARDYALRMGAVAARRHISPAASERMAAVLDWPMDRGSNRSRFASFGAKGGAVSGVITDAAWLEPTAGDFAGERRVVAIFLSEMSGSAWLADLGTFAHQDLLLALATDRGFTEEVRAAIAEP